MALDDDGVEVRQILVEELVDRRRVLGVVELVESLGTSQSQLAYLPRARLGAQAGGDSP